MTRPNPEGMTFPGNQSQQQNQGWETCRGQKQLHSEFWHPVSQVVLLNLTSHRKGSSPFLLTFVLLYLLFNRKSWHGRGRVSSPHTHGSTPVARPQRCLWLPRGQRPRKGQPGKSHQETKSWGVGAQMGADHWRNQAGPVGHASLYTQR